MVAPLLTHQVDLDVSGDQAIQGDGTVGALAGYTVGQLSGITVGQLVTVTSNETITRDVLLEPGPAAERGRDRVAQDAPPLANEMTWTADNRDGRFSPDSATSPIRGGMRIGRGTRWTIRSGGAAYAVCTGSLKEINPETGWSVQQVRVRALSQLGQLVGRHAPAPDPALPVPNWARLWAPLRTDQALRFILEAAGITDPARRAFDVGDTNLLYFWIDPAADLFDLAVGVWAAEGPGARLYDDPDGVTVFKRRSSEITESRFSTSQATFADTDDGLNPWYDGWTSSAGERLMVNRARIDVVRRVVDTTADVIGRIAGPITLSANETRTVPIASLGSDPISSGIAPVTPTDYRLAAGALVSTPTIGPRTNGAVIDLGLTAGAGGATVEGPASNPTPGCRCAAISAGPSRARRSRTPGSTRPRAWPPTARTPSRSRPGRRSTRWSRSRCATSTSCAG